MKSAGSAGRRTATREHRLLGSVAMVAARLMISSSNHDDARDYGHDGKSARRSLASRV
jgi:hypothetical protein